MEFLLIVFLTLLNGVFAMSELAMAASRKARLSAMAEAGDAGAAAALALMANPTNFLSTVQVGITSIGVLNGIIGEAAFSKELADRSEQNLRNYIHSRGYFNAKVSHVVKISGKKARVSCKPVSDPIS